MDNRLRQPRSAQIEPVPILRPGRNCWRVEPATRARLLSNSFYFRALARSLERAERSVLVLGWDLDPRLVLDNAPNRPANVPLIEFLDDLLERKPALRIRILLWDRTIFYGGNRKSGTALRRLAKAQHRLRYCYQPARLATSHHAKLVAIDEEIAFVGGIDLTGNRWDPANHPALHPHRVTPSGETYGPIHDLQMLVEGPAARTLSKFARERWRQATGKALAPVEPSAETAWPPELEADFHDVPAGIARTTAASPASFVREVGALNRSALAGAQRSIYIETQYLTSEAVGDMLARRLAEPNGPEIVIVVTRHSRGYLESFVMGGNRDRLLRRLAAADRWGRLRVFYPTVRGEGLRVDMKIHAKLVIVDDRLLRVGSSNLNNRSMSVDTECDIAIEPRDPAGRRKIAELRYQLIAELLHCSAAELAAAATARQSLIKAIEALNTEARLRSLIDGAAPGPSEPMAGTPFLDPKEPAVAQSFLSRLAASLSWRRTSPIGAESEDVPRSPTGGRRSNVTPLDQLRDGSRHRR